MSSATHLPPADYEPRDAPPRLLLIIGGGLAAGVLVSLGIAMGMYFGHYHDAPSAGTIGRQTSFRHSAEAKSDIAADWIRQDAAVREHLTTYGWVDRDSGVVRIPIDRAMEQMLAEQGQRKEQR